MNPDKISLFVIKRDEFAFEFRETEFESDIGILFLVGPLLSVLFNAFFSTFSHTNYKLLYRILWSPLEINPSKWNSHSLRVDRLWVIKVGKITPAGSYSYLILNQVYHHKYNNPEHHYGYKIDPVSCQWKAKDHF